MFFTKFPIFHWSLLSYKEEFQKLYFQYQTFGSVNFLPIFLQINRTRENFVSTLSQRWDRKIMRTFERGTKANGNDGKRDGREKLGSWDKRGGGGQRKRSLCNASANENLIRSFNLPDDSTCGLINLGWRTLHTFYRRRNESRMEREIYPPNWDGKENCLNDQSANGDQTIWPNYFWKILQTRYFAIVNKSSGTNLSLSSSFSSSF